MKRLSRDQAEYYISEIGLEDTLQKFNISEEEMETLLNGELFGESPYYTKNFKLNDKEYIPLVPCESSDACHLYRVVKEHYKDFRRIFVRNKYLLNKNSQSKEDIFHNALLRLLKSANLFVYKSDQEAIRFINVTLRRGKIEGYRDENVTKTKTAQLRKITRLQGEEDPIYEGYEIDKTLFKALTKTQIQIIELIEDGKGWREIAQITGVDVSKINQIQKQIKSRISEYKKHIKH